MNLKRVAPSFHLLWPAAISNPIRHRGGPGYKVDLDAPLEREWCEGQMHKLENIPEGEMPDGPDDLGFAAPRELRRLAALKAKGEEPVKPATVTTKIEEHAEKAAAAGGPADIPEPEKPKRPKPPGNQTVKDGSGKAKPKE